MDLVSLFAILGAAGFLVAGWIRVFERADGQSRWVLTQDGRLVRRYKLERERRVEDLVDRDFVHKDFVADPTHFDEQGRYLWWGC